LADAFEGLGLGEGGGGSGDDDEFGDLAPVAASASAVAPALPAVAPAASAALVAPAAPAAPAKPRAARGKVTDHVELDQTTITGNRELPNVMVIVPWKESGPGEPGKPGASLLDEALAPLDREEFRRELQYDQALRGKAPPAPAKPAPVSNPTSP
jgi:hypothetical protein